MRNKYLGFIGFLSLATLLTSGCATTENMAKMDDSPAAESTETTMQSEAAAEEAASAASDSTAPSDVETPAEAAETAPAAEPIPATDTAAAPAPEAVPEAATQTASDAQIAAKLLPLPPEEVINTIQKLTKHPRVLYMSSKAEYNYYVGGLFNAEYNPGKQIFTISNDTRQDNQVSCQYGKDGTLIGQAKLDPNTIGQCSQLVDTLSNYLSN